MEEFWRVAPKRSRGTSLSGSLGIVCPVCGVKLRVLQGRVQVSLLLTFLLPVGLGFLLAHFSPVDRDSVSGKLRLFGLIAVYLGGVVLQWRWAPRLLQLRFVNDGEAVEYPLVILARELAEKRARDAKMLEEQLELESPDVGKPAWTCGKCCEENPGNFDVCWKCQAARPSV
jgi:hypothetical protein